MPDTRTRPTKASDLARLPQNAIELEAAQDLVDQLIDERRAIWARRDASTGGDTSRTELARLSSTPTRKCDRLNVVAALKPHLVKGRRKT